MSTIITYFFNKYCCNFVFYFYDEVATFDRFIRQYLNVLVAFIKYNIKISIVFIKSIKSKDVVVNSKVLCLCSNKVLIISIKL